MKVNFLLTVAFFPFLWPSQETALPSITPTHLRLEFVRDAHKNGCTDYVYSTPKTRLYVLTLEPSFDRANHATGVDLVLRDVGKPKPDENLLEPSGNWHGLQPFNFVANDLLHGVDKSAFGALRDVDVKSRGLKIAIRVDSAHVAILPDGTNELDRLKLSLAVENLPH